MRRMITEKEADKLKYLVTDKPIGVTRLIYDGGGEVDLKRDAVELRGQEVRCINTDNNLTYCSFNPNISRISSNLEISPNGNTQIVIDNTGIFMVFLPPEDPHNKGYLWNDNGTVKISLG